MIFLKQVFCHLKDICHLKDYDRWFNAERELYSFVGTSFPIRQNWKHARSGIRTHAPTRRPENPNSWSEAISQSTDDLKSGAFDHSAILAPFDWIFFANALKQCRLCVEWFPFIVHLKSAKHAPLSVLSATHDGESAGTLLALHRTLGHQDHVHTSPIQLRLI